MEALMRQFRRLQRSAARIMAEVDRVFEEAIPDKAELEDLCEPLSRARDELDQFRKELVTNEAAVEAIEEFWDSVDEFVQDVGRYLRKCERALSSGYNDIDSQFKGSVKSGSGLETKRYKLPKIEIRKFGGELRDWLGFWAQFEKIDTDEQMHDCDKFQYLIQSLVPGTHAYELVNGFPQSGKNYPKAVEALKKRYGNEDLLLQFYIRELLQLVIGNLSKEKKLDFQTLHTKLDSHLKALRSLNLANADPETWLFPLVESSLPKDTLMVWQRSATAREAVISIQGERSRLDLLMQFLEDEVSIQQRVGLACQGFDVGASKPDLTRKQERKSSIPTLASFHAGEGKVCIFCERAHEAADCAQARLLLPEKRRTLVREKKVCYICLKASHIARNCKQKVYCTWCGKRNHLVVMCPENYAGKPTNDVQPEVKCSASMGTQNCCKEVLLQTLRVKLRNGKMEKIVRAFLDNGSQRSYILKGTALELGLQPIGGQTIVHKLFGGNQTKRCHHNQYRVGVSSLTDNNYFVTVDVHDQEPICATLPQLSKVTSAYKELQKRGIKILDMEDGNSEVELLIGSDFYGKLLTGRLCELECGLVVVETKLGWTVSGALDEPVYNHGVQDVLTMHIQNESIANLWDLEAIGIHDSDFIKTAEEEQKEASAKFVSSLRRNASGRYVASLPFKESHPRLPDNRLIALKRLSNTTNKLIVNKMFSAYSSLFDDWLSEGFIEEVTNKTPREKTHYLPHRAVVKVSSQTTPVRPVFDASCKVGTNPSLNECLYKGDNYILRIPEILWRFREKSVGFVADIRKAFQMIEVREEDRDCMRFLWWKDYETRQLVEYRHVRVMFGATCSPFMLGAVIGHHLQSVTGCRREIAARLMENMYVDNCVCSEDSDAAYHRFRDVATELMAEAKMDLRLWQSSVDNFQELTTTTTSVLGILWDREEDVLKLDLNKMKLFQTNISKRQLLSIAQSIFDPIGIVSPVIVPLKAALQRTWVQKLKWDAPLPENELRELESWLSEVHCLSIVSIPRKLVEDGSLRSSWSLHIFVDASSVAYGVVGYLRSETKGKASVRFVGSKSRVSPVKSLTIPRLELMACVIGSRLGRTIVEALKFADVPILFWTDSTTALAWIKREDHWATFVGNRVAEIRKLSNPASWRHVPGLVNPADIVSRGCMPAKLIKSKLWEGPDWLWKPPEHWPNWNDEPQESLVCAERKRTVQCVQLTNIMSSIYRERTFAQRSRIMAWCLRFIINSRTRQDRRDYKKTLQAEEIRTGESKLIFIIQNETTNLRDRVKSSNIVTDLAGVLRLKTSIICREDNYAFRYPAVLPGEHTFVKQLVMDVHRQYCHAGVGFVLATLRESYWVLRARQTVRAVLGGCVRCRRYNSKPIAVETAPLPLERVQGARAFETVGIDLAGPLFVKPKSKVYVVIFTCALYRAVYLHLVSSLRTKTFLIAFRHFIRMYGRPSCVYSDNGTNFRGADNLFKQLDWSQVELCPQLKQITWKFNIPTAPWWGGWWERIIRTMKDLMRRMFGNSTLKKCELEEALVSIEEVINGRPLTYVSEDEDGLEPLTPAMFVDRSSCKQFPEEALCSGLQMRVRYKYLQTLRKELEQRFRKEYLGMLVGGNNPRTTQKLLVGEVVFVGTEGAKRSAWKLGKILQLFPGRDGLIRVAKVRTIDGELLRPVQRLYPLEMSPRE